MPVNQNGRRRSHPARTPGRRSSSPQSLPIAPKLSYEAFPQTSPLYLQEQGRCRPTSGTRTRSGKNHNADVSFELAKPWATPPSWKLRSDIRTRLSYQDTHGDNFVLNPLTLSRESRLTDNGRRAFSFSADTDVAENLSSSFVFSRVESFDKNLNRRFTQTVLSAVLHLQFFAGDLK